MLLDLNPHGVITVGVLLPTLAAIAVALRFYSRRRLRVPLREDDWAVLASAVLVWGLGITNIAGAALGALGAHSAPAGPDAPHDNTISRGPADKIAERIVLGYSIVEKVTFGAIKISVLLAYRRIFRGRPFNIASLCMITVCVFLALAFLITSAFQCHVRNWSRQYLAWSHRHHCIQAEISWSGFAISDVVTDLIILLFPVPLVWSLQLTLSKKISVILVFLLGSLSTAIGVVRMAVVLTFTYGMAVLSSPDFVQATPLTTYRCRYLGWVPGLAGYDRDGTGLESGRGVGGGDCVLSAVDPPAHPSLFRQSCAEWAVGLEPIPAVTSSRVAAVGAAQDTGL
ncbi:uncharacterized protein N7459_009981 [Penicillium hispanicum]|uniref:uncharacterized protein n=1 Tax=Penicillium hispanicum TaxID=1080232 RepID=UPI002540AEFE|nr:uncharacterized protein N7459_009981 [Penicillium hispanicum]KAJ5570551.1 hypothetical protein N7459_009981 [Penicillium hispanicum]